VTVTISRLFDDRAAAMQAVGKLQAAGLPHSDISMVSSNADNWYSSDNTGARAARGSDASGRVDRDRDGVDDRAEGAGTGAGVGAVLGGAAGLLAGLGLLAIPGLGPVVAAGWLASTATGAAAGALGGGVIGALTQAGVPEEEAHAYAEGIRRGGTLVTARVPEAERARYEAMLDMSSVNIKDRSEAYRKAGWNKFDPSAPPFSAEEVQKERELYRTHRGT
jgi:hypothetical protein